MIQVDNAFRVAAPAASVFDALSDVETVVECLPGARVMGAVDGRNVLVQARVLFGKASISYRGSLHVTGDDRGAKRISYRVRGREIRGEGVIEAIVDVLLAQDGYETVATVKADASLSGRGAVLQPGVVAAAARTLLVRFGEALSARVAQPLPAIAGANRVGAVRPDVELMGKVGGADEPEETDMVGEATSPDIEHAALEPGPEVGRRVAGEVRLMTDQPVEIEANSGGDTLLVGATRILDERPWLAPACLLGVLALVLIFRRRRDR